MEKFRRQLELLCGRHVDKRAARRWVYVPYDQLNDQFGPLSREKPENLGAVFVESSWKASRRPYHKQKLALILANQRHFALEQAKRGVDIRYITGASSYGDLLAEVVGEIGPLDVMDPAERELRVDLAPRVRAGEFRVLPHEGWLTTLDDFRKSQRKSPPWRMDSFYRHVRKRTGILMDDDGRPIGGKFSFDAENRKAWRGRPPAARPPRFRVDEITREVEELVETHFSHHPGILDIEAIPTNLKDVEYLWRWAKRECMPYFGPYEDAMSTRSTTIFHTRISALMNIHRLLPKRVVEEVNALDLPIASQEGFLRQVLGWREFMRHVHVATDGFRDLPGIEATACRHEPGDGGFSTWAGRSWGEVKKAPHRADRCESKGITVEPDGGSLCSVLGAARPVPRAFWGEASGMNCLDTVVQDVWREGYSHHITRLMVLGNLATLFDVAPRDLTDWFWCAYIDAYDWVVEPNVMGMATFALGELFTTKPYISGQAYIEKMSNYCSECALQSVCPVTRLYWAFLSRHRKTLNRNPRLRMAMANERKRSETKKQVDSAVFVYINRCLSEGARLEVEQLKELLD